jgi:uncharacterized protein (TIGR02302 family)
LRAAEQALREALQRGASDEELKKLMKQLRDAANRFMSEMARNSPDSSPEDQDLQAQDLDKLMDQMEDAARNGSREDAQAMLDQMQEMMENMRSAQDGQESPADREMRKQIGELEKLLRDQQALRDDTFRSDQKDRARKWAQRNQSPGRQDFQEQQDQDRSNAPDQGDDDSDQSDQQGQDQGDQSQRDEPQLGDRQQALRDRLAELQRKLKSLGMKGEKGFDDAQGDMKEAEGDLKGSGQGKAGKNGQGGKGAAVDAQGRALEALRDGAQGLQKQMDGQGQGKGKGKGGKGAYVGRRGRTGQMPGDDPLGRGAEGERGREDGPLKGSASAAERARRVMEELRRRLANPDRPVDERDYLERLMKRDSGP